MKLDRGTRDRLMHDLLVRSAASPRKRAWWFGPLLHYLITLVLTVIVLLLFSQLHI